jgi:hypothetical protein
MAATVSLLVDHSDADLFRSRCVQWSASSQFSTASELSSAASSNLSRIVIASLIEIPIGVVTFVIALRLRSTVSRALSAMKSQTARVSATQQKMAARANQVEQAKVKREEKEKRRAERKRKAVAAAAAAAAAGGGAAGGADFNAISEPLSPSDAHGGGGGADTERKHSDDGNGDGHGNGNGHGDGGNAAVQADRERRRAERAASKPVGGKSGKSRPTLQASAMERERDRPKSPKGTGAGASGANGAKRKRPKQMPVDPRSPQGNRTPLAPVTPAAAGLAQPMTPGAAPTSSVNPAVFRTPQPAPRAVAFPVAATPTSPAGAASPAAAPPAM